MVNAAKTSISQKLDFWDDNMEGRKKKGNISWQKT